MVTDFGEIHECPTYLRITSAFGGEKILDLESELKEEWTIHQTTRKAFQPHGVAQGLSIDL